MLLRSWNLNSLQKKSGLSFHKDERLLVVLEERTYIKVYALKEISEESIEVNRLYVTKCPETLDAVCFEDGESEFTCACGRRPKPKKPCKFMELLLEEGWQPWGKTNFETEDIAKEVEEMSQESILAFEKSGEVTISDHCFKLSDIKVVRDFKRPDGTTENDIDAIGDGDVLVVLDLRPEESFDVDS